MGQILYTLEYVKKRIHELDKDYIVIDKSYIDNKFPLRIKHLRCGRYSYISLVNFKRGIRCKYCSKNHQWTDLEFKNKVKDLVGSEYTFLDKYINCHTKLRVIHNECELIYEVTPNNFIRGRRCPICNRGGYNKQITHKQMVKKLYDEVGDEYEIVGKYRRASEKIGLLHKKCNKIWYVLTSNFFGKKQRCPYCNKSNKSKDESIIENWLKKYNIDYEREYTFNDCRRVMKLKFDFMIRNTKGKIFCLIEYDGEQHFHKDKVYWRKKNRDPKRAFNLIKERDKIKNDYCKNNNITLFRISYKDIENIHYILAEEIFGEFKKELGIKKKYKKVK